MENEQQSQNLALNRDLLFATTFFNLQQRVFTTRRQVDHARKKNAKHPPKTCNETMLHNKLRVVVSRISPTILAQERAYRATKGRKI